MYNRNNPESNEKQKKKRTKTTRFYKNSKLSLIGETGKKEILRQRVEGRSYRYITEYLNKEYGQLLKDDGKKLFSVLNIFNFFKRAKDTVIKLKKHNVDTFKKGFDNSGNINKLMKTLNGWLEEYKSAGEKLPLKQTIAYLIKLYDLRVKIDQFEKETSTDDNKTMVKEFINKISNEFSNNPKQVTKEVEIKYNREGVVTSKKAKITKNLEEDVEEDVEEIEEEEEVGVEA